MIEFKEGDVFAGHRIEGMAGRGGMGVVYRATDLRLKRTVAIKVIAPGLAADPNFQERFERECELAASIRHPNVIQIFSAGEDQGAAYVTMPFVEGTDLADLITRNGRQPLDLVSRIALDVGSALDAAHARNLVHRDVKPANVLIEQSEGGEVDIFLTDFGLMRHATAATRFTATGAVIGTLDYMAPEQIENAQLDARTDVYALGCVIYEALTGTVPFPDTTPPAKLFAHTRKERPSILAIAPDLPPELDRVVQKGMAVDREERYQTAGELGRAVKAAVVGDTKPAAAANVTVASPVTEAGATTPLPPEPTAPTAPAPPTPPPPATPTAPAPPAPETGPARRKLPLAAIALGLGALAMTGVILAVLLGGGDEDPGGGTGSGTTAAGSGDTTTPTTTASAVTVPSEYVAFVEGLEGDGGGIEQSPGLERRTELVELRGDAQGTAAVGQALDELILNRWFRGEAEQADFSPSIDAIEALADDPDYIEEVTNLTEVGYEEAGIRFDFEVRLMAEELYGEDSAAVDLLTSGYDTSDYDTISSLIEEWRPLTGCIDELAPLSELCGNGPDPQG